MSSPGAAPAITEPVRRDASLDSFLAAHPTFRCAVLGHGGNRAGLDLCPLGVPATLHPAEENPNLVAWYHAANQAKFPGALALPGWVLVDLYLLPGAITLLLDDATPDDPIVAAWCGVPTVLPGVVMGVSLISLREGLGAAWAVKRLGLAVLRARVQRGLTQWDNRALRAHARLGALRIVGPAPLVHGAADRSFVYEIDLEAASPGAAEGAPAATPVPVGEGPALAARAAAGEALYVVAPGLDREGNLTIVAGSPTSPR